MGSRSFLELEGYTSLDVGINTNIDINTSISDLLRYMFLQYLDATLLAQLLCLTKNWGSIGPR